MDILNNETALAVFTASGVLVGMVIGWLLARGYYKAKQTKEIN